MRFYAGDRGLCIFSCEGRPTELRFHDPATGHGTAVPSKGAIPDGQWVTVRWVIDADETSIFVNDQLRHRAKGNYSDWSGVFGIGPSQGSVVTVRSVTVTSVPAEAE